MATLKVAEVQQHHVGRGRAIVDPQVIEENGWSTGQILEISHGRSTHAKLWPGDPGERGAALVRLDGTTRQNAGAGLGERVEVRAAEAAPAARVVLSPETELSGDGLQEYMAANFANHVFTAGDTVVLGTVMGGRVRCAVASTRPARAVIAGDGTSFELGDVSEGAARSATYDELGGLGAEVKKIREMVELPMRHPELFEKIGVEAPKGVLLHGPPGTGKTLLARAVAGETNASFTSLSGPEIMGKHYGESEERLRGIFEKAERDAPSIIFIDEIDSIAPKRDEVSGEAEKRIVAQLLTLMDGIRGRGRVVVIAATNRPDSIDPALRRPGRLDREIEIGVPDEEGRREILKIHTRGMPVDEGADLARVARVTHGFVGADLQSLAKEAAMGALRRILPDVDLDAARIPAETLQRIRITGDDFDGALREVGPSALREVLVEAPRTAWEDVGGLDALKEELREAAEWPLKHAEAFRYAGAAAPTGILLHGPPGTGKTLAAKALATMTESNFIGIKGPELLSKWVGESEKGVREVFRKARQAAPCIIFLDEVDALAPRRGSDAGSRATEGVVSQLLTEMDGLEELRGVVVVGATNRPDIMDEALLRPGRFDRMIEVPPPDAAGRRQILGIHTRDKPLEEGADLDGIAGLMEGFSGAEIAAAADRAALAAIRRSIESGSGPGSIVITGGDLADAAGRVRPSK
ncbi:MAG: CDC48 family AAA ATPase [Nitrosopumilus sp.]|nr:CDC48 family AAA ATPase [Nitrosopumilus sp.]